MMTMEFNQASFDSYRDSALRVIKVATVDVNEGNLTDARIEFEDAYKYMNDMSIELDKLPSLCNHTAPLLAYDDVSRLYDKAYHAYLKAAGIE